MKIQNLGRIAIFAALLGSVGCATQHSVNETVRADAEAQIESLVVFAALADDGERQLVEHRLSERLNAHGIPASVSYKDLPEIAQADDHEAVKKTYRNTGANMALTIDVAKERSLNAQKASAASNAVWIAALVLDAPEIRSAAAVSSLAAYNAGGKYELLVRLWDAETGEQLWQMKTQSFSNDDLAKDIDLLASSITRGMSKERFLPLTGAAH